MERPETHLYRHFINGKKFNMCPNMYIQQFIGQKKNPLLESQIYDFIKRKKKKTPADLLPDLKIKKHRLSESNSEYIALQRDTPAKRQHLETALASEINDVHYSCSSRYDIE